MDILKYVMNLTSRSSKNLMSTHSTLCSGMMRPLLRCKAWSIVNTHLHLYNHLACMRGKCKINNLLQIQAFQTTLTSMCGTYMGWMKIMKYTEFYPFSYDLSDKQKAKLMWVLNK